MKIEDPIKTTVEELRKLLEINNFVGEPIETEDKMLIPVMKMGMGFGAGMGKGEAPSGEGGGIGSGAGAAAGVEPVAMVVILKGIPGPEGVRVLNLSSGGPLSKAIGEIGTVITDVIKETRTKTKKEKAKEEEAAE